MPAKQSMPCPISINIALWHSFNLSIIPNFDIPIPNKTISALLVFNPFFIVSIKDAYFSRYFFEF